MSVKIVSDYVLLIFTFVLAPTGPKLMPDFICMFKTYCWVSVVSVDFDDDQPWWTVNVVSVLVVAKTSQ